MRNGPFKRLISVVLALTMLLALAIPAGAVSSSDSSSVSYEQVDNSTIENDSELLANVAAEEDESDETELYADTDVVRVSIVLEEPSTLDAGYSTTDIAENEAAMSYRAELETAQAEVTDAIESETSISSLDVVWNLTLAANIISANVEYGQIEEIEAIDGVAEVVLEAQYEPAVASTDETDPNMSTSSSQIGSTTAYLEGYTGAGMRIAIIDTGIDSDHQSFDADAYLYALKQNAEELGMDYEEYLESLDLLDEAEIASKLDLLNASGTSEVGTIVSASSAYVSSKIAYAYNYIDQNYDITHDNDSQGEHGSHVTGIAAANRYISNGDGTYSEALDTVLTQGVAPDAQIITMKVFGTGGGAYDSDYMAAIEDAIILGADAINLSIGSSSSGFTTSSTYQAIMDSLTETDTVVSISAGNSYSWSYYDYNIGYIYADEVNEDRVGSPGSFTNSIAVASVDNDGFTGESITVNGNNVYYTQTSGYGNAELSTIASDDAYTYVLVDGVGTEEQFAAIADLVDGAIAMCYRGTTSFYVKANHSRIPWRCGCGCCQQHLRHHQHGPDRVRVFCSRGVHPPV